MLLLHVLHCKEYYESVAYVLSIPSIKRYVLYSVQLVDVQYIGSRAHKLGRGCWCVGVQKALRDSVVQAVVDIDSNTVVHCIYSLTMYSCAAFMACCMQQPRAPGELHVPRRMM